MSLGILEQVGLATTLIFALPVAVFGVQNLLEGAHLVGAGFLVVAVLMVALPRRLTTPEDVPGEVAERAVGSVVRTPDGNGDSDGNGTDDAN